MDTSRRNFLAAAGAASASSATLAQEQTHEHQSVPSDSALRVKALESLLVEKGIVDPAALDKIVDYFENKVGPRDGARVDHTRLPRYARGKQGIIARRHGIFVFPDTNAHFAGENPQHLYSVSLAARELWGAQASPRDTVHLDMWDDYLDRA